MSCSDRAYFGLFGSIRQRQGSALNQADMALSAGEPPDVFCAAGAWTSWNAIVGPGSLGWAPGRATVSDGRASICGPYVCTHVTFGPEAVRIVREG